MLKEKKIRERGDKLIMMKDSFNEFKECVINNDFDRYILWQGQSLSDMTEMEIEMQRIKFDLACKDFRKEFNNPNEFLEYSLRLYFSFASRYNVNVSDILSKIQPM